MNRDSICAFGGAPIIGSRVVRFVYMDEAGVDSYSRYAVVSGVVVHADKKLDPLYLEVRRLVEKYIPKEDRHGFFFHLTDLWSGKKYFSDKDVWPLEARTEIMFDLAGVPQRLGLPVIYGFVDKKECLPCEPEFKNLDANETGKLHHTRAYCQCLGLVDRVMRDDYPDEVAQMVCENTDVARKSIADAHDFLQKSEPSGDDDKHVFPIQKIRNNVMFSQKYHSPALQVADMCAFVIKKHLEGNQHIKKLFAVLEPALVT